MPEAWVLYQAQKTLPHDVEAGTFLKIQILLGHILQLMPEIYEQSLDVSMTSESQHQVQWKTLHFTGVVQCLPRMEGDGMENRNGNVTARTRQFSSFFSFTPKPYLNFSAGTITLTIL